MRIPTLPFKILALAPFTGDDSVWPEKPIRIEKNSFDTAMGAFNISFHIPIPKNLCPAENLSIPCRKLKDFHPDSIIGNNELLSDLLNAGHFLKKVLAEGKTSQEIGLGLKTWPNLPKVRLETIPQKSDTPSTLDDILKMVALPGEKQEEAGSPGQLDTILAQVMEKIFSHERMRTVEAAWRGLKLLLEQGGMDETVQLEIVPTSFGSLDETLSGLTAKLVDDPPSLIIVDLPFESSAVHLRHMERIADLSAMILVPTILWVAPRFLYVDRWEDLKKLPFLPHYMDEHHFAKWRKLKEIPKARWLAASCNRFLTRYPYGTDNMPRLVRFTEPDLLWISPVWGIASLMAQSVHKTGWPARFTEWENIRLKDLALNMKDGMPISTEALFSEDRISQFTKAGIIPLVGMHSKDFAFLPRETTISGDSLSYQAFVSRITHFVLWCRDNFKGEIEPAALKENLKQALFLFCEQNGDTVPENIEISASPIGADNRIYLRIDIKPSRQMLPSGEKVALDFAW